MKTRSRNRAVAVERQTKDERKIMRNKKRKISTPSEKKLRSNNVRNIEADLSETDNEHRSSRTKHSEIGNRGFDLRNADGLKRRKTEKSPKRSDYRSTIGCSETNSETNDKSPVDTNAVLNNCSDCDQNEIGDNKKSSRTNYSEMDFCENSYKVHGSSERSENDVVISSPVQMDQKRSLAHKGKISAQKDKNEATPSVMVPCFYCDNVFKSQPTSLKHALKLHSDMVQKISAGIRRKCPYCSSTFGKSHRLLKHIGWKHRSHPEVLIRAELLGLVSCSAGCGVLTVKREDGKHFGTCRGKRKKEAELGEEGATLAVSSTNHISTRLVECYPACIAISDRKELFSCGVCKRNFRFHCDLVLHEISHVTKPSGESNGNEAEENHEKQPSGVKCLQCTETFTSVYHMKTHALIHTHSVAGFVCPYCAKILSNSTVLDEHIDCRHTEVENFLCSYCGAGFKTNSNYRYHMRTKHHDVNTKQRNRRAKSVKSLTCAECGHVAGCASQMKRHVAWQHKGQSEYKCQYCDVMFKSVNHLDDHVARHLGFKRYQCPLCKICYTNEGTLYNHLYRYKIHGNVEKYHRSELTLPLPNTPPTGENINYDITDRVRRGGSKRKMALGAKSEKLTEKFTKSEKVAENFTLTKSEKFRENFTVKKSGGTETQVKVEKLTAKCAVISSEACTKSENLKFKNNLLTVKSVQVMDVGKPEAEVTPEDKYMEKLLVVEAEGSGNSGSVINNGVKTEARGWDGDYPGMKKEENSQISQNSQETVVAVKTVDSKPKGSGVLMRNNVMTSLKDEDVTLRHDVETTPAMTSRVPAVKSGNVQILTIQRSQLK